MTSAARARAAAELGWTPTTSLAEGVRRYVEWYRASAESLELAQASRA